MSDSDLFWRADHAGVTPSPLTLEGFNAAVAAMREQDEIMREQRRRRAVAWHALNLDWSAMSPHEVKFLVMVQEVDVVHPRDFARTESLVAQYRRDQ